MKNFENLVNEIIRTMAEDGTPVTKAEAEEMAKMELGAKQIKRYETSGKRKKSEIVRKIDPDKLNLITILKNAVTADGILINSQNNEADFSFSFNNFNYTVKLIKHRPKKK